MSKNPEPPASGVAADQPAADQPRRLGVAALLNTSALLCTSALFAAAQPKFPPLVGD